MFLILSVTCPGLLVPYWTRFRSHVYCFTLCLTNRNQSGNFEWSKYSVKTFLPLKCSISLVAAVCNVGHPYRASNCMIVVNGKGLMKPA